MGFHIYCILPASLAVPHELAGIDDRPAVAVTAGSLAAWVSGHDAPPQPDVDAVRRHNEIVVAGMSQDVTPVPVRFGQWCETRDDVAGRVAERRAQWEELLRQFAGRAEYGARVLSTAPDAERDVRAAPPESGRDYMAELARKQARTAARRAEGERIASRVADRLGPIARQTAEPGTGAVIVAMAHLVAWSATAEYHDALREVRAAEKDTRWVLSGPWPPWSFVE